MPKTTLNLSVDEANVERARRYVERHETSISKFVNEIFSKLPLEDDEAEFLASLPPITRRLYGIAAGPADEEDYRRHLLEKYVT